MITQDGRLLSIFIPSLEKDFLLLRTLTVHEGISQLFHIEVELLHEENSPGYEITEVNAASILGMPATITITQRDGLKRYFNGIIQSFSQGYRDTRFSKYRATIVPAVWVLTQNVQSRIFQQLSVPEILKRVFEGFEVVFRLQRNYHPRNYCTQYRESDFNFASRLMEEEGIYYYFEHESNAHKMVVADTPQAHPFCPGKSSIPCFINVERQDDWVSSVTSWKTDYRLQTNKVTFWDFHFQLPHKNLEAVTISRFNPAGLASFGDLEIYDFPGGYARRYDGIDKSGGENHSELQKIFDDNKRTAQDRIEEIDAQYKTIQATSDCAAISTGFKFTLFNHPNKSENGDYIITKAFHHAVQTPGYVSSSEDVENPYMVTFECIPYGSGHPPFRPPRKTAKPVIHGSQTAYVVGPAGEEIFTDKYGRVKVQFHWDREGKDNETSSCWLRVTQSWAGNKWGTMFIPRVGMEVIVSFLEGDPDQPIITGCVYNPAAMPPYSLPEEKTKSTIKSNSSKGGGGFNEFRFEDKKGEEQIFIHAQRRMDVRVRGSLYETCGGNRHEVIGLRQNDQNSGNLIITVSGNYDLHVRDSFHIGIDGELHESVKRDVIEDYQGNLSTIVKNKVQLNALEIVIEAKTKISLKVGGNCVMIDPSGITIAGTMVKINSGGFASGVTNPTITDPLDAEVADNGEPGALTRRRGALTSVRRRRRQLNAQHHVAPPRPGEDPRITSIRNVLANSETGRHALEVYDRYSVNPTFAPDQGSYFNVHTNTVNLDPSEDTTTSALTFVHEMNHAEAHHEHRSGNVANQTRQDYVNTMLQEEAVGTVASIEAKRQLQNAGVDVSRASFPLEDEYNEAYNAAVNEARRRNPNLSSEEADAIGRAAGYQRVLQGFQNGEVVTSNTGENYADYYGRWWDTVHKKK
jgi:type VI secretion system secreted protein VgrG